MGRLRSRSASLRLDFRRRLRRRRRRVRADYATDVSAPRLASYIRGFLLTFGFRRVAGSRTPRWNFRHFFPFHKMRHFFASLADKVGIYAVFLSSPGGYWLVRKPSLLRIHY